MLVRVVGGCICWFGWVRAGRGGGVVSDCSDIVALPPSSSASEPSSTTRPAKHQKGAEPDDELDRPGGPDDGGDPIVQDVDQPHRYARSDSSRCKCEDD